MNHYEISHIELAINWRTALPSVHNVIFPQGPAIQLAAHLVPMWRPFKGFKCARQWDTLLCIYLLNGYKSGLELSISTFSI